MRQACSHQSAGPSQPKRHRLSPARCSAAPRMQPAAPPSSSSSSALAVRLQHSDAAQLDSLFSGVTTLVLDCDGVLWRGSTLLPGTADALAAFRRAGKQLCFLTNNSSKCRQAYAAKFEQLGLPVAPSEIIPTSFCAAAYLQSVGFSQTAFVIGNEGTQRELAAAGIKFVTFEDVCAAEPSAAALAQCAAPDRLAALQLDPSIGAVVVGWDPGFDYARLCYASACLRELPGCLFVGTNLDAADRMGTGRMMPGTGCSIQAVEAAAGRRAVNVGKGGQWLLPYLCESHGLRPEEACIVGDRLDTDIALGRAGGLLTVLTLTGVTEEGALAAASEGELPHYVVPNLAALAGLHAA